MKHDFNFKFEHAINFLKEGAKVNSLRALCGRSMCLRQEGEMLLLKIRQALADLFGAVEQLPKLKESGWISFHRSKAGKK